MSKAEAGVKLVRWLPQIARATADDLARYGPQAARVRTLLDFLPTMSKDAERLTDTAWYAARGPARTGRWRAAHKAAQDAARGDAWDAARGDARGDAWGDAWGAARNPAQYGAWDAAGTEVVNDLITPDIYRILTDPLATGRAFDVLRPRSPENFLDVVRGLGERGGIRQPLDVLAARRFDASPEEVREIALALIGDGMGVDDALKLTRNPEEVRDIALQLIEDGMSVDKALETTRLLVGDGRVY